MGKELTLAFAIKGVLDSSFGGSTKNAGQKLQNLRSRASQLQNTIRTTEQAQKLLSKSFEAGGMSAETFQKRMQEMKNNLKGYNQELGAIASKQAGVAGKALSGSGGSNRKGVGESFEALKGTAMSVAAFAAPLAGAVKTTMDFEAALSKVQSVTNATNEDMKKLSAQAENLGRSTAFSATEAAEAMTYLGMAGWNTNQIMAGMPGLLNLAAASGTDLATTADIVSDDLTAFGMKAEQAGHMADVMAVASSNANTNVEMMGMTFKYAGAIAGALGYKLEDVAVATGLMANAGIKGEQAGTSLRAIMNRLVAPPAAAAKALDQLGIAATNSDGTVKPFAQTLKELRASMNGLTDAEKAEMASDIAGTEAMSGFLAVVNASDEDFNKLTNAVENADGAAEKMAAIKLNNLQGDLIIAKSALEDVAIQVGKALTPSLRELAQEAAAALSSLGQWASQHQEEIKIIGGVAAAIAGAIVGIRSFQLGISLLAAGFNILKSPIMLVVEHFGTIKTAASVLFSVVRAGITTLIPMIRGLFMLIAGNPIVAAIMVIVGILIYLWNTNEDFKNAVTAAWEFLCDNIGSICAVIAGFVSGGPIRAIAALLATNEDLRAKVVEIWDDICSTISGVVDSICIKYDQLKEKLSHPIDSVVNFVTGGGGDVAHNAAGGIYSKGAFLTTFAEKSPEAAIPLDGSARAERLWRETGSMMGLTESSMNVSLSIPVTINGSADAGTVDKIQQSIDSAVERALARISHQRGRVSYA